MKECKKGYYYCTKEKKCMPIPSGMRVGYGGWLMPDKKKNGKKNGSYFKGSFLGGDLTFCYDVTRYLQLAITESLGE